MNRWVPPSQALLVVFEPSVARRVLDHPSARNVFARPLQVVENALCASCGELPVECAMCAVVCETVDPCESQLFAEWLREQAQDHRSQSVYLVLPHYDPRLEREMRQALHGMQVNFVLQQNGQLSLSVMQEEMYTLIGV